MEMIKPKRHIKHGLWEVAAGGKHGYWSTVVEGRNERRI